MKKLLATVLAASLLLCLLPTAALAEGESGIQLGTAGLKDNDEIYFGNYTESGTTYDVPWIVLNKGTNEAFLLSKYLLGDSQFRTENTGYYSGGALNTYMDGLYNGTGFTSQERGAIATVTSLNCGHFDDLSSPSVSNAHLYPLSNDEVDDIAVDDATKLQAKSITAPGGSVKCWWLRSSARTNDRAAFVSENGVVSFEVVSLDLGARPAFNLDLSKVLFTSAAADGKASGTVGAGALNSNLTPSSASKNTWKLTLLDSSRSGFAISTTALTSASVTANYSGAKTGTNEYISAMIVDNGAVAYYGRVKNLTDPADASGTVTVNIPSGVTLDSDTTLRIFNEQYNGDYNTDYSGALLTVTMPNVTVWPETLPNGMENTAYSAELTATNSNGLPITGEAAYSLASGALPTGLTLVDQAGNIGKATLSGTPALAGTYTFTVQAEVNDGTPKSVG